MSNKKNLRFTKDYNLPINIFNEEMFSYYRDLYKEFWPFDAEYRMNNEIKLFNDNVDEWLAHYAKIRDNIIFSLENSEEYKEFNQSDLSKYDIPNLGVGEHSLYNEESEGGIFLSIDLKKANFQALKYVGVLKDETYKDFIHRNNGTDYFADSKYLRQVIFGKLNPKRQIKVEKYLIYQIHKLFSQLFINDLFTFQLYSLNSDEIVYKIGTLINMPTQTMLELLEKQVKETLGIEVRAELVQISRLNIVNSNGNKVDAYIRKNVYTGVETLKKASTTFFPQIWKLYKGLEINEMDKTFFFEDQLAVFKEPLKLIE
jgi:hypothetical protein